MKLKIKNLSIQACFIAGGALTFISCNDFLDRGPLSSVTPEVYFQTADHLAAYSIAKYQNYFSSYGGYGVGMTNNDGGIDNIVAGGCSSCYVKGLWKVPSSDGNWSFSNTRYCNYFFENAVPRYEAGEVAGADADIRHYIGEIHLMRVLVYYNLLRNYGDFPIITGVLPDDKAVLMEKGVCQPRNLVARFILKDLDDAVSMMYSQGFKNNTRLNRETVLLVKSRAALYEAPLERYHKDTRRVPGDNNWPEKKVHPNFSLDVEAEVDFFLAEATKAVEEVADKITLTLNTKVADPVDPSITSGWNPYFEMYATVDLGGHDEVLFWRQYIETGSFFAVHGVPAWIVSGSNHGLLKSYVESFLMQDGLLWYAVSSAALYKGDTILDSVKANRDNRLQLFISGESNFVLVYSTEEAGVVRMFASHPVSNREEMRDQTGYRIRKYANFDTAQDVWGKTESTTGYITYRGIEAYLNYLEAYYMRNGNMAGKAAQYWRAIRERAGLDPDFTKTINATDSNQETDRGKYSGAQIVDATLLNIRRECRCEFIGESVRWNDLACWCSMGHLLTKNYMLEGCNFQDEMYKSANKDENGVEITLKGSGKEGSNISSRTLKYLYPYAILKANNDVYDGYIWQRAHYPNPVSVREIELLSPDEKIETSVLYQNPYWPTKIGEIAEE